MSSSLSRLARVSLDEAWNDEMKMETFHQVVVRVRYEIALNS